MHKNINNSVVIESNASVPTKKKVQTKIGNYVGGFATNSSVISNQEKQQIMKKMGGQKLAQNQINFIGNFSIDDSNNLAAGINSATS